MTSSRLRVLIAATEIYPLAKTGGLADAAAALGAALVEIGFDVHFVMPAYAQALEQIWADGSLQPLPNINGLEGGMLLSGKMPDSGVPVHLVDLPTLYRDGGELYVDASGQARGDNPQRFAAFAHAACELALGDLELPGFDIVHCNDWQAGLIPLLLQIRAGAEAPATVFTIHNMAFQGQCPAEQWGELGVPLRPEQWPRVEYYGQASFLKAGLEFADQLTAVSPRYAEEIQTSEFGFGMEGIIQARRESLTGILNGIDVSIWSPERSPWIAAPYSVNSLTGKARCKQQVQQELGLETDPSAPLMTFIGRLTWQKMADVLLEALPRYFEAEPDRQFVLLGNGDRALEARYLALAATYPGRMAALIDYTEERAHQLHAGADILIHGSRFEPCGLTQMYSMRFGTIPVVRPVGGLADTVLDYSPESQASGLASGFQFEDPSPEGMLEGIQRAIELYRQPESWLALQRTAMTQDHSWSASARAYAGVYERARAGRAGG